MKFIYAYKTSDGVRHEDAIEAKNRDEVFSVLRTKGIKAIKVVAADGSRANGAVYGVRKRVVVILSLLCLAAGGFAVYAVLSSSARSGGDDITDVLDAPGRRQIIGDPVVVDQGIRTGWANVFENEGDRFLAGFAVPGTTVAVRTVREDLLAVALAADAGNGDGTIEGRQIAAIVRGMKREIASLVSSGWSLKDVGLALANRQDREIDYRNRAQAELAAARRAGMAEAELDALWTSRNASLREMGIQPLPLPE